MASITKDQVIDFLANMSVLEMSELVKEMEEKFGVSAAAAAVAARLRILKSRSAKVSDQSDATEQLLDSPVRVCRKALDTLLDSISACLDDPLAVTRQWLLQQGGKLLQGSGGGLINLGSRATAFQEALKRKLSEEDAKRVGCASLGQRLNTHVRSQTAKRALAGASRYATSGHAAMLKLVLSTDPLALTKDEKDLAYLLEKLGKLEEADVTSELWQDFYEKWASFLSLCSRLEAQCAQQIFDAIATDEGGGVRRPRRRAFAQGRGDQERPSAQRAAAPAQAGTWEAHQEPGVHLPAQGQAALMLCHLCTCTGTCTCTDAPALMRNVMGKHVRMTFIPG